MTKQARQITYYISTALFSAMSVMAAGMYFLKNPMVSEMFLSLGYPTHIIYPLAVAKLLGVITIWSNKCPRLKEWAYAGFFFVATLATTAHLVAGDGQFMGAAALWVLVVVSYVTSKKK